MGGGSVAERLLQGRSLLLNKLLWKVCSGHVYNSLDQRSAGVGWLQQRLLGAHPALGDPVGAVFRKVG